MRRLAIAVALLPGLAFAEASTWNLDSSHTQSTFTIRHLVISNVRGEFGKTAGVVKIDDKDVTKSSVEAEIDTASINTREQKRDDHLRSPDFFDAAKHPKITFKSTKVEKAGKDKLKVTGDLTIHGVTKPVVLDVESPRGRDQGSDGQHPPRRLRPHHHQPQGLRPELEQGRRGRPRRRRRGPDRDRVRAREAGPIQDDRRREVAVSRRRAPAAKVRGRAREGLGGRHPRSHPSLELSVAPQRPSKAVTPAQLLPRPLARQSAAVRVRSTPDAPASATEDLQPSAARGGPFGVRPPTAVVRASVSS